MTRRAKQAQTVIDDAGSDRYGTWAHRRVAFRFDRFVATVYLYGRDETATPELAVLFARKMSERMRPPEPEPMPEGK